MRQLALRTVFIYKEAFWRIVTRVRTIRKQSYLRDCFSVDTSQ